MRRRPIRPHPMTPLALVVVALVALGCGGGEDDRSPDDGTMTPPGGGADAPIAPTDDLAALEDEIALAIADAAAAAGVDASEVALVSAEMVTWSDGSIGCPEPGMVYTQALVDGYRIVVEVAGARVDYHGALGSAPFRCDDPTPAVG
jgi:hypothetical protein